MATVRLNQLRIAALTPRKSAYDVRDRELKGFGVRVLPSGAKRYFIHSQHQGRRVWKIVGDTGAIGIDEARVRARTPAGLDPQGRRRFGRSRRRTRHSRLSPTKSSWRYARNWKPSTLKVNRGYYRNQILPYFAGRPISEIAAHDVQLWFASLHETPVAADRSAPVLSVIMRQAEVYGYRPEGTNPCAGIKRYRRQGRERFLSAAEMRRLGEALARHEANYPQTVAIIRLLLLTGCRTGEIVSLQWRDYREGKLFLRDSKTGPRTIWLSSASPHDPRRPAPRRNLDVPLAAEQRLSERRDGREVLVSREGGGGSVRRPPSRLAPQLRQHGLGAGRDGADYRPPARTQQPGNDAEIHPICPTPWCARRPTPSAPPSRAKPWPRRGGA